MKDVDNTKEFRCISLCTGYAGIELGLRRVVPTLRTVAYVEVEAFACANLVAKMEAGYLDAAPIWTDIKTFDGQPFYKRVHIVTGGYPCQPFSVAGKREGTKDPRHLWPYIARIVQAVRPVWCFFENVPGHLTSGFPEVYRSLRDMGYSVEAGLFTAAECELDIERERLFVLARTLRYGFIDVCCKKQSKVIKKGCVFPQGRGQRPVKRLGSSFFPGESKKWESKAEFCGNDNEIAWQVDRLRLLGNGVVPAQAERAFRYLMGLFK